jgi:hypothetical protein
MPTDIHALCDTIEDCYEFTLSYAAQGRASDEGTELRRKLIGAAEAMRGLERSCIDTVNREQLSPAEKYEAFFRVLARDAQSAIAAIDLVLVQPAISSQLIDNLNASIHLRALLTDLFLVTEILTLRQTQPKEIATS